MAKLTKSKKSSQCGQLAFCCQMEIFSMQRLGFTTDDDIVLVHQEFKYLQISTLSVSLTSIFCVINFGGCVFFQRVLVQSVFFSVFHRRYFLRDSAVWEFSLLAPSTQLPAQNWCLSHYITLPLSHYITSPHVTTVPLAAAVNLTSITLQLLHYTWRCQPITSYCITLHYIAHSCGVNLPHYISTVLAHYIILHCIALHAAAGSTSPPLNLNLTPTSSLLWWEEGARPTDTFSFKHHISDTTVHHTF